MYVCIQSVELSLKFVAQASPVTSMMRTSSLLSTFRIISSRIVDTDLLLRTSHSDFSGRAYVPSDLM